MGFDLTGYESDNNYSMSSFFIYSIISVAVLVIITFALAFYFFIESERMYDKIVLQDEIQNAIDYKNEQNNILNSYLEYDENGNNVINAPINKGIERAVIFYNE